MRTLEDILITLGSKKPFRKKPIRYDEERQDWLTESGNKAYSKLIDIVYTIGELTDTNMNDIVEILDQITSEQ